MPRGKAANRRFERESKEYAVKRKRNTDYEKVARLIPLRMTGDLNVDDARRVDETVRYDADSRTELESFNRTLAILQEAAQQPLNHESPVVRGEGSLWDRIEPRLGPVGKMRPRGMEWIPTRYLAAACLLLAVITLATESGRMMVVRPVMPQGGASVEPVGDQLDRRRVTIDPRLYRWLQSTDTLALPETGLVIARINRLLQLQLQLADLNGVVVSQVQPGSLAEMAGLQMGDSIIAINDEPVYAPKHLKELFDRFKDANEIRLDIIRKRATLQKPLQMAPGSKDQTRVVPGVWSPTHDWPTTS